MNANEMLRVQDAVFVLAGSVDDFGGIVLAFVADRLAKCVLNRRVVAVDEMSVNKLNREG